MFCERPYAFHCQQPEHDKQNVDVAPLEKFLRTPMLHYISVTVAQTGKNRPQQAVEIPDI